MSETFVAQSTPTGTSALALIRGSGPLCKEIASGLKNDADEIIPRHAYYSPYKSIEGDLVDEVVWIYYPPESSYTGLDLLEIMPHGNPLICKSIIDDLCERGCRLAEPGEFTKTAYLNKKLDLLQVDGVLETIHAQSLKALSVARKRLTGASGKLLKAITQELISLRAQVEAYIDFPEDELPDEDIDSVKVGIHQAHRQLIQFSKVSENSERIQNGFKVMFLGYPNAGKSSLMNSLLGRNRALVSSSPGTTRDYLVEPAEIGGYIIYLYDTAGINTAPQNEIESAGIQSTFDLIEETDLYVWVVDSADEIPDVPNQVLEAISPNNCIVAENKSDLPKNPKLGNYMDAYPKASTSSLSNDGITELENRISSLLSDMAPVGEDGAAMFGSREKVFIEEATNELSQALLQLENDASELCAYHLIKASDSLKNIFQHLDNEQVLDELFSNFCIGK